MRTGLKSDAVVKSYLEAWGASICTEQRDFARNVLAHVVEGIGNFTRFSPTAQHLCELLLISSYYNGKSNSEILHHMAQAKDVLKDGHPASDFRQKFLQTPQTLFFAEAHRRVVTISELLDATLHAERPPDELLLEGISNDGGPNLVHMQNVLATISDLIAAYCESQGDMEKPQIQISYLDLGSNYQIGVKVDGKAEVGPNLLRFLMEMLRWVTNPRAYMRERRADETMKGITVLTEIQKRVDAGELTVAAAQILADRLLGCGQKLASQRVFPAPLFRERTENSPTTEILKLMDEAAQPPSLPAPAFGPPPPDTPEHEAAP